LLRAARRLNRPLLHSACVESLAERSAVGPVPWRLQNAFDGLRPARLTRSVRTRGSVAADYADGPTAVAGFWRSTMLEPLLVVARALALALRGHRELVLENLALRQQLTAMKRSANRPRLERGDRLFWIALARVWQNWRTALVVVQPDTVVRWHRDWLRRRWTRRSKRRPGGRPPLDQQIRVLVRDMATANPLWGAPRIHGELRTLGVDVSERTVSRLLRRYPRLSSQTWKTFLTNHLASAASMDFFTVPTLTGRVLFVLIVLAHHRRRIVHVNITNHPTAAWAAQQVVDAFPEDTAPRWIHRDRDGVYGDVFQRRLASMGIVEVVSAPASPWQNPYAE
jgi:putative transposase